MTPVLQGHLDELKGAFEALLAEADRASEAELKLVDELVIVAAELGTDAKYDAVVARIKELRATERAYQERLARDAEDMALLHRLLSSSTNESDPACPES